MADKTKQVDISGNLGHEKAPLVAIGQFTSTSDLAHNFAQCRTLVQQATQAGAQALFLPEASDYIAASAAESISLAKPVDQSEFVLALQDEARRWKLPIHVGVHEPAADGHKLKNTVLWIDERGEIVHRYQKIHLFDVDIEGGPVLKESECVAPELFSCSVMLLFSIGSIGVLVPFAEAGARSGTTTEKRVSYGHSMIIDPWGTVLADLGDAGDGPKIGTAVIDHNLLRKVRTEVPLRRRT
ncbi:hypothetical protein CHGG_08468 [Chaetomium globosum CBS 148.51]|uniref:CN hydrolase domain-containing protein n=1 Tax=Chaetomium globosum (strain ATCC 6205 / CBS 148.51 / DSM 1962 / NBRC 6347 / NRRL 1970) TaxID=306901 RepID=Q2GU86_CHAGB|nr:uncharacterized protein CHGG_08468 [Chaetomium globosum CBS 148.51]EAQ84454.1 hypothetical protein CHGG_08468 [Chaetomium globosum CBS 148.51]